MSSGSGAGPGLSFGMNNHIRSVFDYRRENSCPTCRDIDFTFPDYTASVQYLDNGRIRIHGAMMTLGRRLMYWAPGPAYRGMSFSGSNLPFPSAEIAYDGTPNHGVIETRYGSFDFTVQSPNSYYTQGGTVLVPPTVHIVVLNDAGDRIGEPRNIVLGPSVPYRTLTIPPQRDWNLGPMFYHQKHPPIRTQEEILRAGAYDCKQVTGDFWRTRPAR